MTLHACIHRRNHGLVIRLSSLNDNVIIHQPTDVHEERQLASYVLKHAGVFCLLDSESWFYMLDNTILTSICTCYLCKRWSAAIRWVNRLTCDKNLRLGVSYAHHCAEQFKSDDSLVWTSYVRSLRKAKSLLLSTSSIRLFRFLVEQLKFYLRNCCCSRMTGLMVAGIL